MEAKNDVLPELLKEFAKWLEEYSDPEPFESFKDAFETFIDAICDCGGTHCLEKKPDGVIEMWDIWHDAEHPCLQIAADERGMNKILLWVSSFWYLPQQAMIDSVYELLSEIGECVDPRDSLEDFEDIRSASR